MAKRVVDMFETVQINQNDRTRSFLQFERRQGCLKQFGHSEAVQKSRKRVIGCELGIIFRGSPHFGDVGATAAKARKIACFIAKGLPRNRPPDFIAVRRGLKRQIVEFGLFG